MSAVLQAPGLALSAAALIALRPLALGAAEPTARAALPGGFVTRRRGHGQETADVREYVAGDDIRHLDRGSTARTGTLHVRTFHEERDRVTLLIADFRPSMLWGTRRAFRSVAAAEVLALIGWRAIEEGGRIGLLAVGADRPLAITARGRARGMLDVIGGMVRAHDAALHRAMAGDREDPPLDGFVARAIRLVPAGAEVVIASGFDVPGDRLAERLGQIAQRRTGRLVHVVDSAADALPPGVYPIRLPDGTRRHAHIGTNSEPAAGGDIAGHPALRIDAGLPLQQIAGIVRAAFPPEREP